MSRMVLVFAALIAMVGLDMESEVFAHGGSWRGPNGAVPPGLREPFDAEPPPPPPSDPGGPGPRTPGDDGPGPITPTTPPHNPTEGDAPPPTNPGQQSQRGRSRSGALTLDSWRFWWAYNNDDILNLKSRLHENGSISSSVIHFTSKDDARNRRSAQRPTRYLIDNTITPAFLASIARPGDHEDIHGGALVALGKIGTASNIALFRDVAFGEWKNARGASVEFGPQARESAVLALGLLPDLTPAEKNAARGVLLEMVASEKLRSRDRAWAAVSLGLQRDVDAIAPLRALLRERYADDNIPAGILCGLGLIGDRSILDELNGAFVTGTLDGRDLNDRLRAFVGYALAKIADAGSVEAVLQILHSRSIGRVAKRSAAIAAGTCGANATPEMQDQLARTLERYIGNSGGDASGEGYALVSLARIGTERAMRTLLSVAEDGKYGQRSFAAIALGTRVFHADAGTVDPVDSRLRADIVKGLAQGSERNRDADTRAAFLLSRGLVKDATALDDLLSIVAKQNTDPVLRGFCCVSLGLLGDAREEVKVALRLALDERASTDLRRDAATGLGLLHDSSALPLLLDRLRTAKSFAVQGQLITAIGTIGDHTAVTPLVELLNDASQPAQTRALAAVGLGMIGDLRELPALARLSKDYNYRASVPDLDELLTIF